MLIKCFKFHLFSVFPESSRLVKDGNVVLMIFCDDSLKLETATNNWRATRVENGRTFLGRVTLLMDK